MSHDAASPPPPAGPGPRCAAFAPLLPLLHTGELAPEQPASLEEHLAECAWCRARLAEYDALYAGLRRRLGPEAAAADVRIPSAGEIAALAERPTSRPRAGRRPTAPRARRPRLRPPIGLEAAAALLLIALLGGLLTWQRSGATTTRPTPTPTPTATPTTMPTGPTVLFQNSLAANPDATAWIDDPTRGCFFAGGGYHVKDLANCQVPPSSFTDLTSLLQDADVTVQVRQVVGPTSVGYGIGLVNRVQSDRFDVRSDGQWAFVICHGSTCTANLSPTASPAIHTGLGATNTLEVRVLADHFDFYVNGTKVGQADDANYDTISGQIALDGSDGIEVVFNNLKIATAS